MIKKLTPLLVLLIPLLVLGAWTANLTYTHFYSARYHVKVTGYDPRDLIHGRHIIFSYNWASATPPISEPYPDFAGRYYLPEHDAPDVEAMLIQNNHDFSAIVTLPNGKPQILEFLIDNTPWQEALAEWRENRNNTTYD